MMNATVEARRCIDCESFAEKKDVRCSLCSFHYENESKEPWEKWVEVNSFPKQMRLFKC